MEPTEDELLVRWRLAQAYLSHLDRETDAWRRAAGDEWRAQMAYHDRVNARLSQSANEADDRRRTHDQRRRSSRQ